MVEQQALDRMIEEIKAIHAESIERMTRESLEQLNQVRENFEEQIRELRKQNDGLLGAVGRLHAEREAFSKQIDEEKKKNDEHSHKMKAQEEMFRIQMLRELEDNKQTIQDLHEELAKIRPKKGRK